MTARAALVVAAVLAVAVPAATAARTAAPAPVLGRDWKTRTIAWFDPLTLKRVSRSGAAGGFFTGPWAYDAGRTRLALSRYDFPVVRLVQVAPLRLLGDVRLTSRGTFGRVEAVAWTGTDRLLVTLSLDPGVAFVVVDARARRVVRTASVAGTGAVMRTDTVRAYASEAGFTDVEVLPIDNDFWRFYRLTP